MKTAALLLTVLLLVSVSVLYGMVSYSQQLPPYGAFEQLHRRMFDPAPAVAAADTIAVPPPIRLLAPADVDRMRADLIALLWGDSVLPSRVPNAVEPARGDTLLSGVGGVARIERLTIEMGFGLRSIAHHFVPVEPNGRIVIYHAGHGQVLSGAKLLIEMLAQEGYAVVGLEMPLEGYNRDTGIARLAGGTVALERHADFDLLRPDRGHAMQYFIEPVVIALNHVEREYGYDDVAMIGLSGGGWTTTLAAAVDPRIRLSFPVAGSQPRYLRVTEADRGDWEQRVPAVYDLAGYRELYVLGASGNGRKQVQVLNIHDPCCFGGLGWQTYVHQVADAVKRLGPGEFHVLADDTHDQHAISGVATRRILHELAQ